LYYYLFFKLSMTCFSFDLTCSATGSRFVLSTTLMAETGLIAGTTEPFPSSYTITLHGSSNPICNSACSALYASGGLHTFQITSASKKYALFLIKHALVKQDQVQRIPQRTPIHVQPAFYTVVILGQSVPLVRCHDLSRLAEASLCMAS